MPDTLGEIRGRDAAIKDVWYLDQTATDRRALIAHIDALAAAVRALPETNNVGVGRDNDWQTGYRGAVDDVLAILGEPE